MIPVCIDRFSQKQYIMKIFLENLGQSREISGSVGHLRECLKDVCLFCMSVLGFFTRKCKHWSFFNPQKKINPLLIFGFKRANKKVSINVPLNNYIKYSWTPKEALSLER